MPQKIFILIFLFFFLLTSSGQETTGTHGAITYSVSTGRHGFGVNYSTEKGAQERALQECARFASDCIIVVQFQESCAALVLQYPPEQANALFFPFYIGIGTSESAAEWNASEPCEKESETCIVRRILCTAGTY